MNKNTTQGKVRISKKHPILLVYAIANIGLLIFDRFLNIRNNYKAVHMASSQYSASSQVTKTAIIVGVFIIIIALIAELYLIFAKDLSRIKLILKVFLGFQLVGLLLAGSRGNILAILIVISQACFTFTTLKYISDKNSSVFL